jgi:hypothetical protein
MRNFFGNIDDQSFESMHLIGNSWLWGFLVIGACLLAAGWLVRWQVRRVQGILERQNAAEEAAKTGGSATGEPPKA